MQGKILIVEDDISFGKMLESWFSRNGYDAVWRTGLEAARRELEQGRFALILTDLRLPDGEGTELLGFARQEPAVPVIVMTGYAEIQTAVAAIKAGAADYLEKPINPSVLKEKIEQTLSIPVAASKPAKPKQSASGQIIHGSSPAARRVDEMIRLVAPTRMSVIILGESGTGKEYTARAIHQQSDRRDATFIAVDCGSLSRELAPSELFGHIKGSFTSAVSDKRGVFQEADGGTVFLDEIGNLPYEVQIQLLRAIQEKKFRPVGAVADIPTDVRIIAATNEDLEAAIREGKFREDLYHRLNEFSFTLPPLRERTEDIRTFAEHFLREANDDLGRNVHALSGDTLKLLEKQPWSGNLRELRNVIRRAILFSRESILRPEHFSFPSTTGREQQPVAPLRPADERERIEEALRQTGGNKAKAARLLGVDRKTLYNKMHLYGMEL